MGMRQPEQQHKHSYAYKSTLKKEYGLSDSWVRALGEPDRYVPNPHYRSGPPSSLYLRSRVEAYIEEHHEQYKTLLQRRAKLSKAASENAAREREKVLQWAREVPLGLTELPEQQRLLKAARRHFEELAADRGWWDYDGEVTDRGLIAYVRHNLTDYEQILDSLNGSVGSIDAYLIVKARANASICERLGIDLAAARTDT